jgi:hypothetical protein
MITRARTHRMGRAVLLAALMGVVALSASCAPAPPSSEPPADIFAGGTYPIELVVPSQTASHRFDLFGLGTCTTTTTTPSFRLVGTATLAAAELSPGLTSVVIPEASVDLPGATVSAGSVALECFGVRLGSVGLTVNFDGAAIARSARLDLATRTVTFLDPALSITNASFTLDGLKPVPLDPFKVTVPSIDVVV